MMIATAIPNKGTKMKTTKKLKMLIICPDSLVLLRLEKKASTTLKSGKWSRSTLTQS